MDNAVTNDGKKLVFEEEEEQEEEENVEQMTRVEKHPKADHQTSERWTPYFKSKRLHSLSHGEAVQSLAAAAAADDDGDDEASDSKGLETAAMQECQSIRRAPIEVIGPNNNNEPLNLGKLHAEFDTGADDCMMTQSCYEQLKGHLEFHNDGEVEIEGATGGQVTMMRYVELDFNIGSIHFPPGVKFWVNETLPEDADFDVLLSGPFLAHHNVIYIDPALQREIEKDGKFDLKMQKHFDFFSSTTIARKMTKQEKKGRSQFS